MKFAPVPALARRRHRPLLGRERVDPHRRAATMAGNQHLRRKRTMMERSCGNCRHFHALLSADLGYFVGTCHRQPPSAVPVPLE